MPTPSQIRAARGLLNWSQSDLAMRAGVTEATIRNCEKDDASPNARTANKILEAFEFSGIEFNANDGVGRKKDVIVLEGDSVNNQVLDDIYNTLKDTGGEVLIAGLKEVDKNQDPDRYEFLLQHIDRLQKSGITERMIVEDGDDNFIAPRSWYRSMPSDSFNDTPFQIYGDKIAIKEFGKTQKIILIKNAAFARTMTNLFNMVWEQSKPISEDARDAL